MADRKKYQVIKFVDGIPNKGMSQYAVIPSQWIVRNNPRRKDGTRSVYLLFPPKHMDAESTAREAQPAMLYWTPYKADLCDNATDDFDYAKEYALVLEEEDPTSPEDKSRSKKKKKPKKISFYTLC